MDIRGFLILETFVLGNVYALVILRTLSCYRYTPTTKHGTYPWPDVLHAICSLWHSCLLHWTVNLDENQTSSKMWSVNLVSFCFLFTFSTQTVLNVWMVLIWIITVFIELRNFFISKEMYLYITLKIYLCRRMLNKINRVQIQESLVSTCFNLGMSKISWV